MRIRFILLPLLAFFGPVAFGQDRPAKPRFTFDIGIDNPILKVGSPVSVKIYTTNISSKDVNIGGAINRETGLISTYTYEIRDGGGNLLPEKKHSEARSGGVVEPDAGQFFLAGRNFVGVSETTSDGIVLPGRVNVFLAALKPGKSYVTTVDVSQGYDMNLPGKYTIELSRRASEYHLFQKI